MLAYCPDYACDKLEDFFYLTPVLKFASKKFEISTKPPLN